LARSSVFSLPSIRTAFVTWIRQDTQWLDRANCLSGRDGNLIRLLS